MVQRSIKNLPKKFSELTLPGSDEHFSEKAEKILKIIGKTPEEMLKRFREDSLNSRNFSYGTISRRAYYCNGKPEFTDEDVKTLDNTNVPPITVKYEGAVYPFLKPYLDYEAYDRLDLLFEDVNALTCKEIYHNFDSGVFSAMQKYFLEHYEEAEQICLDLEPVKKFVAKMLKRRKGYEEEYERAMSLCEEDGEVTYAHHKHDLDPAFLEYLRELHGNELFWNAVTSALYIKSEEGDI